MSDDTKRLNVVISTDLHRELKVEAAKKGTTIGAFVAEAIAEKIKKEGSKRPTLEHVDHTFNMNNVKYTKYLISFK